MFPRRLMPHLILIGLLATVGCDAEKPLGPVTTAIVVTTGTGLTPAYTWTGGKATKVSVARSATPTVAVWEVTTAGTDGLSSPVTHGTIPTGATRTVNTEPALTKGIQYKVTVSNVKGTSGSKVFIP